MIIPYQPLSLTQALSSVEVEVVSVFLSAIAYGFIAVLSCNGLWLVKKTNNCGPQPKSCCMLLAYITAMFLLSTGAITQEAVSMVKHIRQTARGEMVYPTAFDQLRNTPLTTPFIMIGADTLLIWRCFVLYKDTSRRLRILLYCSMALIFFCELGGSVTFFLPDSIWGSLGGFPTTTGVFFLAWSTFACNIIFSTLIVARILQHKRMMRKLGLNNASPYPGVISMCIESAILIVCASLVYIVIGMAPSTWNNIAYPLFLLPHISVISSLLIVFRVAQGKAFAYGNAQNTEEIGSDIRFSSSRAVSTA